MSVVAEKPYIQPTKEKLEASFLSHPFAEHGPRPLPGSLSHLSGPFSPGYIPWQIQNLWTVASYDTWVNWTAALLQIRRREFTCNSHEHSHEKIGKHWLIPGPLEYPHISQGLMNRRLLVKPSHLEIGSALKPKSSFVKHQTALT